MKKVMMLTIVIMLLATAAFAVVKGTEHDLSTTGTGSNTSDYDEVCVFCHTPHNGATNLQAPLWNRSYVGDAYTGVGDLYNSVTLETDSLPSNVFNAVNRSDARLCMSCHDGTALDTSLLNDSTLAGAAPTFDAPGNGVAAYANLGSTLVNDHPIGMNYLTVQTADGELVDPTGPDANGDYTVGNLPLYADSGGQVMWCSSCHDVHDDTNVPFLNESNAGSALCTTCHQK